MTYITLDELYTALRTIDALAIKGAECEVRSVTDAIRRIRFIGHDAVEVVRCRECKHMDLAYLYCHEWEAVTEEDGYCYMGEKE